MHVIRDVSLMYNIHKTSMSTTIIYTIQLNETQTINLTIGANEKTQLQMCPNLFGHPNKPI